MENQINGHATFPATTPTHELGEDTRAVLRHTKVEHASVNLADEALQVTLDWQTEGDTFSRKLSGLRHAFRVYTEQLDRTFAIEEHDGMADLLEEHPRYTNRVEGLLQEHDVIRDALDVITMRLERCLPADNTTFEDIQNDIHTMMVQVRGHMRRECELIMDAFNTDIGCGD